MKSSRRCSKAGCGKPAVATLTYAYSDSTAVIGPLALQHEPGCYDLCREHSKSLSVPRGWEVVRLPYDETPPATQDDLAALADAVREVGLTYTPQEKKRRQPPPEGVVEIARRKHLTVLTDVNRSRD